MLNITNIEFKKNKTNEELNLVATISCIIDELWLITGIKIYETFINRQFLYIRYPNNFNISKTNIRLKFENDIFNLFEEYCPLLLEERDADEFSDIVKTKISDLLNKFEAL